MDKSKLENHIKLCVRNLRSKRVVCCASCPFEEESVSEYPDLRIAFEAKRKYIVEPGQESAS